MSKITVTPSQTEYETQDNETLLAAAIRNGINLPHACQSGVCGSCRAQLISGSIKQSTEYDDYVLSQEELDEGMILLCCCQAQSDVVIDMPTYAGAKALTIRTLPARVASVDVRDDTAVLKVALPKAPPFVFYAGQYMDILLKEGARSYSIANAPNETGQLEFHVRLHEGGLFSPQLFDGRLKAGSIIRLRGPFGAFTLSDHTEKPLILLATGTGFAPIKSLLTHIAQTQAERSLHFYFGNRHRSGFYDDAALQDLLSQLPNARYTPVLSRPDAEWTGKTGHVTEHVLADYPDLSGFEVYACGSPEMIAGSRHAFTQQAKLPEHAYFSDAFTAHIG